MATTSEEGWRKEFYCCSHCGSVTKYRSISCNVNACVRAECFVSETNEENAGWQASKVGYCLDCAGTGRSDELENIFAPSCYYSRSSPNRSETPSSFKASDTDSETAINEDDRGPCAKKLRKATVKKVGRKALWKESKITDKLIFTNVKVKNTESYEREALGVGNQRAAATPRSIMIYQNETYISNPVRFDAEKFRKF